MELKTKKQTIRRVFDRIKGTYLFTLIGTSAEVLVDLARIWPAYHTFTSNAQELCGMSIGNKVGDSAAGDSNDTARLGSLRTTKDALYANTATFGGGGGALDPTTIVLREQVADKLVAYGLDKRVDAIKAVTKSIRTAFNRVMVASQIDDSADRDLLWQAEVDTAFEEAKRRYDARLESAKAAAKVVSRLPILRVKAAEKAVAKAAKAAKAAEGKDAKAAAETTLTATKAVRDDAKAAAKAAVAKAAEAVKAAEDEAKAAAEAVKAAEDEAKAAAEATSADDDSEAATA